MASARTASRTEKTCVACIAASTYFAKAHHAGLQLLEL
jgi:hypothetical protein